MIIVLSVAEWAILRGCDEVSTASVVDEVRVIATLQGCSQEDWPGVCHVLLIDEVEGRGSKDVEGFRFFDFLDCFGVWWIEKPVGILLENSEIYTLMLFTGRICNELTFVECRYESLAECHWLLEPLLPLDVYIYHLFVDFSSHS